jgi:hypothetical protein
VKIIKKGFDINKGNKEELRHIKKTGTTKCSACLKKHQ